MERVLKEIKERNLIAVRFEQTVTTGISQVEHRARLQLPGGGDQRTHLSSGPPRLRRPGQLRPRIPVRRGDRLRRRPDVSRFRYIRGSSLAGTNGKNLDRTNLERAACRRSPQGCCPKTTGEAEESRNFTVVSPRARVLPGAQTINETNIRGQKFKRHYSEHSYPWTCFISLWNTYLRLV